MKRRPGGRGVWAAVVAGVLVAYGAAPDGPGSPESAAAANAEVAAVAAQIAEMAAAVTGQQAKFAAEVKGGSHVGFDTNIYPGDKTMLAWKNAEGAPYSWVGYYLPAPCHKDTSWSGKRDTLRAMGWGLAVVYVGQQTWDRMPRKLSPARMAALVRSGATCNADYLSAERGILEANDAIAKTEAEGFPRGTVVFLDIERMEKMPQAMRDYYRTWVAHLLADGRYRPGIYTHKHNAAEIYADVKRAFEAAGLTEEPRFWIASGRDFHPSKPPTAVGHAFAGVWQGVLDAVHTVADIALPIDVNVAAWPSPSETGTAVE